MDGKLATCALLAQAPTAHEGCALIGDPGASCGNLLCVKLAGSGLGEAREDGGGAAGNGKIAAKPANGNMPIQRVERAMDDLAVRVGGAARWDPGDVAFDGNDEIGFPKKAARVIAEVHGMS